MDAMEQINEVREKRHKIKEEIDSSNSKRKTIDFVDLSDSEEEKLRVKQNVEQALAEEEELRKKNEQVEPIKLFVSNVFSNLPVGIDNNMFLKYATKYILKKQKYESTL